MQLHKKHLLELKDAASSAALLAGQFISEKANDPIVVERKTGGESEASQVVTEVDRQAQAIILKELSPTIEKYDLGLLTEESEDDNSRFSKDYFWCIDPLDGTLPFIESTPGYSVSIALVSKDGTSQLGVIFDPVNEVMYDAVIGNGAFKNGEVLSMASTQKKHRFSMISDRSFLKHPSFEAIIAAIKSMSEKLGFGELDLIKNGGGAMNAIWVLQKSPACYFKFPRKANSGGSLWDYAASACVVKEAGAHVSDIHGNALDLNRADSTFMNHRGILYASDIEIAKQTMGIYQELKPQG